MCCSTVGATQCEAVLALGSRSAHVPTRCTRPSLSCKRAWVLQPAAAHPPLPGCSHSSNRTNSIIKFRAFVSLHSRVVRPHSSCWLTGGFCGLAIFSFRGRCGALYAPSLTKKASDRSNVQVNSTLQHPSVPIYSLLLILIWMLVPVEA